MRTARYALLTALVFWGLWLGYVSHGNIVLKPAQTRAVVFIGDSITNHWDLPEFIAGYRVIKHGVDGDTTSDMVARFETDVLQASPDMVFILGGINDIQTAYMNAPDTMDAELRKTRDNIGMMTEWARRADIEPVLCAVLPVGANSALPPEEINTAVQRLNVFLEEIAGNEKVSYLDLGQALSYNDRHLLKEEYARPDGLHISPYGYQQLTLTVSNFLH